MSLETIETFLNGNFSAAFFGAVGASFTVFGISWIANQRKNLAQFNIAISCVASASNSMLNMKNQHSLPLLENFELNAQELKIVETIRKYSGGLQGEPLVLNMPLVKFYCPKNQFDFPDQIFSHVNKDKSIVQLITQTKLSIQSAYDFVEKWNNTVDEFRRVSPENKVPLYMGLRCPDGSHDTSIPDTIRGFNASIDDALFFLRLAENRLYRLSQKVLPFWHRKSVKKSVIEKKYLRLFPSVNHIEGWE